MEKSSAEGFTLIELLVVVTIVGILAAIAVPNLLNALDRGKQKRTMADIRSIASAVESYSVDLTDYPVAGNMTELKNSLEPTFIQSAATLDAWGRPLSVASTQTDYTLGSGGKDGGPLNYIGGPTSNLNDAIIYSNGQWWQWPEGSQS